MRLPPGPRVPGPLQLVAFYRDPIRFLRRCQARYGDVFTARFPGLGRPVYVADRAEAKRIFMGAPELFHAGEANGRWVQPVLGPSSIICVDEAAHLRQRRLLLPPFHGERIGNYEDIVVEVATREIERWPLGKPFRLLDATQRITLEVILRAVVGVEHERLKALATALLRLDRAAAVVIAVPQLERNLGRFSPGQRFQRALAAVDELFYGEIERARRDPRRDERDDVLSLLVSARDEDGTPMSDREVRDELMTVVAAGYETTAASLAWVFEHVLHTPAVLDRLLEAPGDDEYLDAVIKETLRLRAPLTDAARILTRNAEVAGYALPKGTLVLVAIPLIHHRPEVYPDPEAFRPERFLGGDAEPHAFVPFGGGRRRCVGAAFAQLEMRAVMRTVLERARLRAASPRAERPRMHHVVLVPSRGARVILEERLPAPTTQSVSAALPA